MTRRKSSDAPIVVGTGLIALDLVYGDKSGPPLGRQYAGGTCGNVLLILAYLGWQSYPVARLRPGVAAERIRADLSRWGVRLDFVARRRTGSTPMIVQRIEIGRDGQPHHRFMWTCPACGSMLPTYKAVLASEAASVAEQMPRPAVFFFDRVSRGALNLAEASAAQGAVVVFEPSGIGDPKLFGEAVRVAHILKYSRERMIQTDQVATRSRPFLEIETMGDEGLRYRCVLKGCMRKAWKHVPAYPVRRLRDAAGSGDWCTAGILSQLANVSNEVFDQADEAQVVNALKFGQALAAWNCGFEGARGGMYHLSSDRCVKAVAAIQGGEALDHVFAMDHVSSSARTDCPACRHAGPGNRGASKRRAVRRSVQ